MSFIKQSWYCKVNETPGKSEKVNKEQPPVLSEDEIEDKIARRRLSITASPTYHRIVVAAQRDADVVWYQGKIKELKDKVGEMNTCHEEIVTEIMARMGLAIQQSKVEEREKVLDEIDTQINKLTEHSNELNIQRQPIIEAMNIRDWTPEEDEFMYSSVHEIIEIPNRITLLNNLKQFIKSEYLKESE